MCSGSGGRSFQLNRVQQLPPTAVEGPCAAKFMLKALVGSGDTAGAAAQSMMDFNTGQHSLRMEPGRAVPSSLQAPGNGRRWACLCQAGELSCPSGVAFCPRRFPVERDRWWLSFCSWPQPRRDLPTILECRYPPPPASPAQRVQPDP